MSKLPRWCPLLMLALAIGVLFHQLLVGNVIFWGTPLLQFYPWETLSFAMFRAGNLPLWNPMVGHGAPLLANYQAAVLYPPNWLYLLIPVEYGMGLIGVAHVLWAGAGMMSYLRRLGVGTLGQGLGAIAFALSGYLIGRFGFLSITCTVAWLPWLMWAVDGLFEPGLAYERWWGRIALVSGVTAMQLLAGHAQTAFYSIVLATVYAIWRLGLSPKEQRISRLSGVMGGLALGALIASAQLIPTAELMLQSQRAGGVDREAGLTYSFWPWRFLTLVAPNLFGSPATGNFDGYAAYWEDAVYVGLLTLVMAGHGLARWWRERADGALSPAARVVPFYAISLPVVFVLALGKSSPIFMWLFDHNVPGFVTFQAPTRWTVIAEFALCILAAIGVDMWHSSKSRLFWTRLFTAGGLSFVIAGVMAGRYASNLVRSGFIPAMAWLGVTIIVVGAVSLLLPQAEAHPTWRPWWEGIVLVTVAADLLVSHWGLNPTVPASYYHQGSMLADVVRPLTNGARTLYLLDDEYQVKFKAYLDFKDFHAGDQAHWNGMRDSLLPNLGMLDGIPSANNFDSLLVENQHALLLSLPEMRPPELVEAMRQMNVSVLLTTAPRSDLKLISSSGPVKAYQVPDPWPRALLADCAGAESELNCQPSTSGSAQIVSDEGVRVNITTSSEKSATLLLLDAWYPGWIATIDGSAATIHRANAAFRAVDLPPGNHRVVFTYSPNTFRVGVIMSVSSLLILAGISAFMAKALPTRRT